MVPQSAGGDYSRAKELDAYAISKYLEFLEKGVWEFEREGSNRELSVWFINRLQATKGGEGGNGNWMTERCYDIEETLLCVCVLVSSHSRGQVSASLLFSPFITILSHICQQPLWGGRELMVSSNA